MSSLIQNIFKLANKLYSNPNLKENSIKSNYQLLINLLSKLKANDVNFNQTEIDKKVLIESPCAYIRLFENNSFNLSIFSIRPNSRLPLHDHPNMNGFLKVISGKIVIKSFDKLPLNIDKPPAEILKLLPPLRSNPIIPTKYLGDKIISENDEIVAIVEPLIGNIHEITVSSDCKTGSAFLDLITPPYSNDLPDRNAAYYKILGKSYSNKLSAEITWLMEIDCPRDYWCEFVVYKGPELDENILKED